MDRLYLRRKRAKRWKGLSGTHSDWGHHMVRKRANSNIIDERCSCGHLRSQHADRYAPGHGACTSASGAQEHCPCKQLDYKAALKECKRVGTAHASGDALRAMYAKLITFQQGGEETKYYSYLGRAESDEAIAASARELLRDRSKAWDVLMAEADKLSAFKGHSA